VSCRFSPIFVEIADDGDGDAGLIDADGISWISESSLWSACDGSDAC